MLEKSCLKDMEIGNLLWGNSRGEFQVPRGEWQDKFQEFLEESGFSPKGHIEAPSLKKWEVIKDAVVFDYEISGITPDEIRRAGKMINTDDDVEEYKIASETYQIVKITDEYYWDLLEEWDKTGRRGDRPDEAKFTEETVLRIFEKSERAKDYYFENETFLIRPYYWGDSDEIAEKPNFVFKPANFVMSWYKWPLRDAYCNQDIDYDWFLKMIEECRKSLQEA